MSGKGSNIFLAAVCFFLASCNWFSSWPVLAPDGAEDGSVDLNGDLLHEVEEDFDLETMDGDDPDVPDLQEVDAGCTDSVECQDGNLCNGEEYCDPSSHTCRNGTAPDDGILCLVSPRSICIGGECRESECGDCFTDRGGGEFCDDCNDDPDDGCHECRKTCTVDGDCDDGDICNGEETCNSGSGECESGTPLADGIECGSDPRKICLGSICLTSICGDGFLDAAGGEECEGDDSRPCTSACSTEGNQRCFLCAWSECVPPPEECNGVDDDCDTVCDNGFDCCAGTVDSDCTTCDGWGIAGGSRTCSGTCEWSACCSELDYCNGCDDDCDGQIDEPVRLTPENRITNDPNNSGGPSVAYNPASGEYGIAFHDNRVSSGSYNYEVFFARLSDEGSILDSDRRISNANFPSLSPSLVHAGSEYAVAWYDWRINPIIPNTEIFFILIDDDGTISGPEIRVTDAQNRSSSPSLVFTGSEFALAWDDERHGEDEAEIYFAKLDLTGTKTAGDTRVTNAAGASEHASLVFTGSRFAVAWNDERDGNSEIYFNLVDMGGTVSGLDVRITDDLNVSHAPSLSYNGSEYAVAWGDNRGGGWGVYFTRIDESGVKIGGDMRISDAEATSSELCGNSLVWNDTDSEYGLLWHDDRDGNLEIYFARLSSDGTRIGSDLRISEGTGESKDPSLAWSGSQWGASWKDLRFDVENGEVYFALIGCLPVP